MKVKEGGSDSAPANPNDEAAERVKAMKLSDDHMIEMAAALYQATGLSVAPASMQAAWDASPGPELVSALKACREDYPDSSFRRYLDGLLSNLGAPNV